MPHDDATSHDHAARDHAPATHDHTGHGHAGHAHGEDEQQVQMLDLDAEVLQDYYRELIGWAGSLVPAAPTIVDLGAGTGTGTLSLARHLPTAQVTAVDLDRDMLDRIARRAADAGLGDRVRTVPANLDGDWPPLGPADLVWASSSMHHLTDPARTVKQVFDLLRPGGVFLIAEMDDFPRFLTGPDGTALEDRCRAELGKMRAESGMHMHENWTARLEAAGFEVTAERRFDVTVDAPLPEVAVRYAKIVLERTRERLADRLSADDLSALDRIVAEDGTALSVHATRDVWTARRP